MTIILSKYDFLFMISELDYVTLLLTKTSKRKGLDGIDNTNLLTV